jgi:hypothetical protein
MRDALQCSCESCCESFVAIEKCLRRKDFFKVDKRMLGFFARRALSFRDFIRASH